MISGYIMYFLKNVFEHHSTVHFYTHGLSVCTVIVLSYPLFFTHDGKSDVLISTSFHCRTIKVTEGISATDLI